MSNSRRDALQAPRLLHSLAWCRYWWGRLTIPLWPPPCRLCRRHGQGPWCDRCDDCIPLYPVRCRLCANPRLQQGTCLECRHRPPLFQGVSALGVYRRDLRLAIHRLKFAGAWDLALPIGERLASLPLPGIDLLVPVPLHADRYRERGYNQAALIAAALGQARHVPWSPALTRLRATRPQLTLDRSHRQANVAGAFAADPVVAGQHIGLIDDVFTTGATAQATSAALLAAGAAGVHVIVVARAIPAFGTGH
jgi:ComF family protein